MTFPNSPAGLEADAVVSLWLDSGGTYLKVEAIVVRTEPGHLAVQFIDLSASERHEIPTKMIRMEIIAARLEPTPHLPSCEDNLRYLASDCKAGRQPR